MPEWFGVSDFVKSTDFQGFVRGVNPFCCTDATEILYFWALSWLDA